MARFDYEGAPQVRGGGGVLTLLADGQVVATGHLPRTLPGIFSLNEGLDVGTDYGSPVGDYPFPSDFTGMLSDVRIDLR